jgi:isopenicillin-N N-acyltransferase like protein
MVSHIVIVSDAKGSSAAVERVPGASPYVRYLKGKNAVTNHFIGPFADDARNLTVRQNTSTLPRLHRATQLVERLHGRIGVRDAVRLLRDRKGVNDKELDLGDRRAIDALIATHGVVMDTTSRTLWVSESPHVLGRFVAFDLRKMLDPGYDPEAGATQSGSIAADPLLESERYRKHLSASQK